jgi:type II secretory pathway pseudopilin PulG
MSYQLTIVTVARFVYKWDMTAPRHRQTAAFSLIELLIVLGLLLVLYVMTFSFGSRTHQATQKELCADNLEKIFLAEQIYANDFGYFPKDTNAQTSEPVLNKLVPRYTADTEIFICPGGRDPDLPSGEPLDQFKISYAYYMGRDSNASPGDILMSDRQINTLPKNVGEEVFSVDGKPPGNNHYKYGGNILTCDGSAQAIPTNTTISLAFSNGIVLLNPKP